MPGAGALLELRACTSVHTLQSYTRARETRYAVCMSDDENQPKKPSTNTAAKREAQKASRKRLAAAIVRKREAAANETQRSARRERAPEPEPEPERGPEPEPQPRALDPRPIAPLWDLPEQKVQIPLEALNYTVVYRVVLGDDGKQQRAHCGQLPPDATASAIKRQWGPGRYFIQARIGQRILGGRDLYIDGPEPSQNMPFGPIGELPSGLVTITQGDPTTAAFFAMFQMWMAQQRSDFQTILGMQQNTLEKLATQHGSSIIATHLREQLAAATARVRVLEEDKDKAREREAEHEREKLKARYKGDKTDWVEVAKAVSEAAPSVLEALPPKVKGFLESLVGAAPELPAGVTEHPLK